MKEAYLMVQTNAFGCAYTFRHQQPVTEPKQGIHRISRRSPGSHGESEVTRRDGLTKRTKVDSSCVPFNTAHMIGSVGGG